MLRRPGADDPGRVAGHYVIRPGGPVDHAAGRHYAMGADIGHDQGLVAQPAVLTDYNLFEVSALFLDGTIRIGIVMLPFATDNMYAAADQRVGPDPAFTYVALRTNIDTGFQGCVPV